MVMLAPVITLIFLAALWLAVRIVADVLAERGSRIAAALRGEALATPLAVGRPLRPIRAGYSRRQPLRVRPELRAAA
jgi:hypothetical protein